MKDVKALLIVSLLILSLVFIAVFSFGCGESYTESQYQHQQNYSLSQQDIEFQQGANRPPTLQTLYSMAKIFISQGRLEDADPLLLRVINQNPEFMPAYNDLAEIKIRKRQTDEAIKILSDALNKNGSDPTILNNLGMCWMMRRNYEKALQHFTEAAGLQPENTRYRANMAVALAFLERDDEALAIYKQILPLDQAKHNLESIQRARRSQKANN